MRYLGMMATSQSARMTNQWADHTHHASVVRTIGSRQGWMVDRMTALATAARTNAMKNIPKRYSAISDNKTARPATLYKRILLSLAAGIDNPTLVNCGS